MKSIGTVMISLYTKVPNKRVANPKSYPARNFSLPKRRKTAQMTMVLQVSIVDLCAADAYLVIITPVTLNPAMVKILQQD
jgi:hypothetical protein